MKIVFMGTPEFAATVLRKLIDANYEVVLAVSQPDRPVGRKKELLLTPVKKIALEHSIPIFQPEKIKLDYQAIIDAKADLIVTAAYGQMIPKVLLDFPQFGCVNVHASLLPKYRGGAPIHQAIIDGEKETGITIQYMEVAMDTGDIISQSRIPIDPLDDVGTMFDKLGILGSELLVETLPSIKAGTSKRIPQNHDEATYAYNIKREDELIDWSKKAYEIHDQIRGLNPWPTAYTTINGVNIKVFKSEVYRGRYDAFPGPAGTILQITSEKISVVTGKVSDPNGFGVLDVYELQIAGKKRMPISDLLNGEHPFKVREVFGN